MQYDTGYRFIYGSLPREELLVLMTLLRRRSPRIVPLVGTYFGAATKMMALNLPMSAIHTIDLPEDPVSSGVITDSH